MSRSAANRTGRIEDGEGRLIIAIDGGIVGKDIAAAEEASVGSGDDTCGWFRLHLVRESRGSR
jgi:hypothetical protein